MNNLVIQNYAKVRLSLLYIPLLVISAIVVFLLSKNALSPYSYAYLQKDVCFFINRNLAQLPSLQHNITQLGDAFIALSLLSVFIIYAPKIWEALISASLLSLLFSKGLKESFDIPRPVTAFGEESLNIVGKTLVGYSSFPSGHSVTIFTTLTILIYAFTPPHCNLLKINTLKRSFFFIGLLIAFSRVGVGAHHPFDVILGCTLGYISGVLGIYLTNRYRILDWISNKKSYPFFILLFLGCIVFLIHKISKEHLFIFYLPLLSLSISLYLIIKAYVKEIRQVRN